MFNDITIVATTWLPPGNEKNRADALRRSILSWQKHLKWGGKINLHIADDGTTSEFLEFLELGAKRWTRGEVTYSQQFRKGVGASLNAGIKQAMRASPLILHAVDDWMLLDTLDLLPWASFLVNDNYSAGMVRFFPHPDLTGTVKHIPPHGWAVRLDPHHYVFGFRPALFHMRFFEAYGKFSEGTSSMEAEADYNRRVVQREGPGIWLALPELWYPIETGSLADLVPS